MFACSGRFRVNANGSKLDVWLIYKCRQCDTTWNMDILTRVNPRQMDKALYERFLSNDAETAMKYAYDRQLLGNNKAVASYDSIEYSVYTSVQPGEAFCLEIVSEYDLGIRLDKLLSDELGISRGMVKRMLEMGHITGVDFESSPRTKVKGIIRLIIRVPEISLGV